MKNDQRIKTAALAVTVLLLAAMYFMLHQMRVNQGMEQELSEERLKSERILSEKLKLQKDIESLEKQIASYRGHNKELDEELKKLKDQLDTKKSEVSRLQASANSAARLKKEREELQKMQDQLNARIADLSNENSRLVAELSRANNMIANLNNELSSLNDDPDNVLKTDNYRLETLKKKNDKLTVRAKKLGKIEVSFDALSYGQDGKYRMVVKSQNGADLKGSVAMNTVDLPGEFYADLDGTPGKVRKRVELEFSPEDKLKEGIYSIMIFHGDAEVGSAQIRLGK